MKQTTRNMIGALQAVQKHAKAEHWNRVQAGRTTRAVLACIMTESNGHMYANKNNPASMKLPHDAVGSDHASVGLFQQQVGFGWGTVEQCMDIEHSTLAFVKRFESHGYHTASPAGRDIYWCIQQVQVSAYPDGSNYRKNRARSYWFQKRWWNTRAMTTRSRTWYL